MSGRHRFQLALVAALALVPLALPAEVSDSEAHGFTVRHSVDLPISREQAWLVVVSDVHRWWSSDHTVSGDAGNLYINPVPLGCFCERLGDAGGLVHLQVTFVNPGVLLRLTGGLGPLGLMGTNGNLTFEFDDAEDGGGSVLTLNYAVGGYLPGGLDSMAEPVDQVLGEQMQRLAGGDRNNAGSRCWASHADAGIIA